MLNRRFLFREMVDARKQTIVFVLCVALSITTMVALSSFREDVNSSITGDARSLHGGDVILHSHYSFSPSLLAAVERADPLIGEQVMTWEFYSVVRSFTGDSTLFSNIKVVGQGYPLYGEVELESGEAFGSRLQDGFVVVGRGLLERLGVQVGDRIHVGEATLTIADVVTRESSRPVDVFNFGPRVFVAQADLEKLQLVKTGSRVEYELLLKLDEANPKQLAGELQRSAIAGQERVRTYQNARSGLKRFFDNLLFFLSLISIFTLLLAGIGMQSSLAALLRQKEKSIAIIKALGAKQSFLDVHYFLLVLIFGCFGSILGVAAGIIVKQVFPVLFSGVMPPESFSAVGSGEVIEGMVLGLLVVCLFTFLPLHRLREVRPNVIFRSDLESVGRGRVYYIAAAGAIGFLTLLVIRQLEDVKIGLYFMAGTLALIAFTALLANLLLAGLRSVRLRSLPVRQAVRSLVRPGNSTRSVIVTLSSALAVLLMIYLVESNLYSTYVDSYPEDAPNLFLVDIQPHQREMLLEFVGEDVELYPIIRARLRAINDTEVQRGQERRRWSDSLTREFNLTYRDYLLEDEQVISAGGTLFKYEESGELVPQVSILDSVAEMGDMQLGDTLHFNIQGVPLSVEITSIRTRTKSMLYPFFYFVFPEQYLEKAPQTLFAAIHVNRADIGRLEKNIIGAMPNVSTINVAETAEQLGAVMKKLSGVVNFFAIFSLLAGALIIISSVLATRLARVREAVYYKVLGAKSHFVSSVFFYENVILGVLSSLLGVLLAQAGSWALCRFLLDIAYRPNWLASLLLVGGTVMLVVAVGMSSSISIIRQKPIAFLREQTID